MSWTNLIFLIHQVIAVIAVIHVVMDNRQPAKTMAWALVIYFVPVVGIVAYLFFGINRRRERLVSRRSMDQLTRRSMLNFAEQRDLYLPEAHKPLIDLFVNQSFSLPFSHNHVEFLTDGYQFFTTLLHDIAQAREHIHIDIYIFEDDALGNLLADALMDKARQGVEVRLIYDDVGCWGVKGRFFEMMREAGIEVAPFLPVRFPRFTSKANYRNHRKVIVIDGKVGYIGGMNIALRYVKGRGNQPWRDTMVRIEGQGVYSLQRAFLIDWYFVDRTLLSDRKYYPPSTIEDSHSPLLQTVTCGPSSTYPEIMQGFVRMIISARRYIYIQTPYFLPTDSILHALKMAASTGVDVRLMVPRYSDMRITDWASRSYLREVSEAGVQVLLFESAFLHAKTMVCDDDVATMGSTNVDFRSFENNFEANVFLYGQDTAVRLRDIFLSDQEHAIPLKEIPERIHPKFLVRLGESCARLFAPLL